METPAVSATLLSKTYCDSGGQSVQACSGVSFAANPGEVFGILGTNGAGKTTTLRLLSTVLKPSGGDATISGCSVVKQPDRARAAIGFLSADTGVYGRLTAREMMEYFGRLHGLPETTISTRVEEISRQLDMGGFMDRRCDRLSSGQKQRVSIARTIVHDPPVLIFDEPTAGLDILASAQIVRFIQDSRARGRCVILSTHIMREAERLCDRLIILHHGRVCAEGTLAELRRQTGQEDLEDVFLNIIGNSRS